MPPGGARRTWTSAKPCTLQTFQLFLLFSFSKFLLLVCFGFRFSAVGVGFRSEVQSFLLQRVAFSRFNSFCNVIFVDVGLFRVSVLGFRGSGFGVSCRISGDLNVGSRGTCIATRSPPHVGVFQVCSWSRVLIKYASN